MSKSIQMVYVKKDYLKMKQLPQLLNREAAPATYTVSEIAEILRIGKNSAYDLAASGELPVMRFRKTIRIPSTAFWEWFDNQAARA